VFPGNSAFREENDLPFSIGLSKQFWIDFTFQMEISASRNAGKDKFTPIDDLRLTEIVDSLGCKDWAEVASYMPGRNARQCRERWKNYVNPMIMRLPWTPLEELLLDQKYAELGPKWQAIAKFFPNRSKNYVKNHWMTKQRRLRKETLKRSAEIHADPLPPPAAVPVALPPDNDPGPTEDLFLPAEEDDAFWKMIAYDYF
jgi:hypothetical protein